MKRAVISLANDRGNYRKGLERLEASIKHFSTADFIGFTSEEEVGAPKHQDNPYAFKLYAHQVASETYDQVIWLDASVYAVAPIDHLFDMLKDQGVIMQEAGCMVGQWCNQHTLDYFGLSRQEAMSMPCYGNAGLIGFDWHFDNAYRFYGQWCDAMHAGCFRGSWSDHRHDLTCGSIIANRMGLKYIPGDKVLQYAAPTDIPNNETICLYAQGL